MTCSFLSAAKCFDIKLERQIRKQWDMRTGAYGVFSMIYFEHPDCSGGVDTFKHWLPRGLELGFFDNRPLTTIEDRMMTLGLPQWPQNEQAVLRDLFCRAAVNWFEQGNPAPLGGQDREKYQYDVSHRIVCALLYLRISASSIVDWLIAINTDEAWRSLINALTTKRLFEAPSYFALDNPDREPDMRAAVEAIERCARNDLHRSVTLDLLLQKWGVRDGRKFASRDRNLGGGMDDRYLFLPAERC